MKSKTFLSTFISMICLFLLIACEKSDIQSTTNQPDSTKPITNRVIDECEDCPVDYCCCGIELLSTTPVTLIMCGVYTNDPAVVCPTYTLPTGCTGTVSSSNSVFILSTADPKELFCLPEGGTFRIYNTSSTVTAVIQFTCQQGGGNPDYESITLSPEEEAFFTSDGDCFLEECP